MMRIYVLIFLALLGITHSCTGSSRYSRGYSQSDRPDGIWKSKTQWKVQWVKEWDAKKVFIPTWKKVWTPVEIKEWIPLPSAPHE